MSPAVFKNFGSRGYSTVVRHMNHVVHEAANYLNDEMRGTWLKYFGDRSHLDSLISLRPFSGVPSPEQAQAGLMARL